MYLSSMSYKECLSLIKTLFVIVTVICSCLSVVKLILQKIIRDMGGPHAQCKMEDLSEEKIASFEYSLVRFWSYGLILFLLLMGLQSFKGLPCVGPMCGLSGAALDEYLWTRPVQPDSFYNYQKSKDTTTMFKEFFARIAIDSQEYHFSDENYFWNYSSINNDLHLKELTLEVSGGTYFAFLLKINSLKPRKNLLAPYFTPIIAYREGSCLSSAPLPLNPYFIIKDSSRSKVNGKMLYSGVFGGEMIFDNMKKGTRKHWPFLAGVFRGLSIDTLPTEPMKIDIEKIREQYRIEDSINLLNAQKTCWLPAPTFR